MSLVKHFLWPAPLLAAITATEQTHEFYKSDKKDTTAAVNDTKSQEDMMVVNFNNLKPINSIEIWRYPRDATCVRTTRDLV